MRLSLTARPVFELTWLTCTEISRRPTQMDQKSKYHLRSSYDKYDMTFTFNTAVDP